MGLHDDTMTMTKTKKYKRYYIHMGLHDDTMTMTKTKKYERYYIHMGLHDEDDDQKKKPLMNE